MKRLLREPLLHFLLIGALALLLQATGFDLLRNFLTPPRIEISQADRERLAARWLNETGRHPTSAELQAMLRQYIDEELMFREALRLGLHEHDVVVHQRLILNMRFAEQTPQADAGELLQAALHLGMLHSDPVVRRRLIQRMRHQIENQVEVSENDARQYFQRHRTSFQTPERYSFEQRFFSADQPGALNRALAARQTLTTDDKAVGGDVFLLGNHFEHLSLADIRRRLGDDIAQSIAAATPGEWLGPVSSAYGQHLLRVQAVSDGDMPDYSQLQARVAAQLYTERERAALGEWLQSRRQLYRINIAPAQTGDAA